MFPFSVYTINIRLSKMLQTWELQIKGTRSIQGLDMKYLSVALPMVYTNNY